MNKIFSQGHNKCYWALTGLYFFSGTMHLIKPKVFNRIIPPQLPGSPTTYTYGSGVAELFIATMLCIKKTYPIGGLLSTLLLLLVWPANLQMLLQSLTKSRCKMIITLIRLPLQIPMIKLSWKIWQEKA